MTGTLLHPPVTPVVQAGRRARRRGGIGSRRDPGCRWPSGSTKRSRWDAGSSGLEFLKHPIGVGASAKCDEAEIVESGGHCLEQVDCGVTLPRGVGQRLGWGLDCWMGCNVLWISWMRGIQVGEASFLSRFLRGRARDLRGGRNELGMVRKPPPFIFFAVELDRLRKWSVASFTSQPAILRCRIALMASQGGGASDCTRTEDPALHGHSLAAQGAAVAKTLKRPDLTIRCEPDEEERQP